MMWFGNASTPIQEVFGSKLIEVEGEITEVFRFCFGISHRSLYSCLRQNHFVIKFWSSATSPWVKHQVDILTSHPTQGKRGYQKTITAYDDDGTKNTGFDSMPESFPTCGSIVQAVIKPDANIEHEIEQVDEANECDDDIDSGEGAATEPVHEQGWYPRHTYHNVIIVARSKKKKREIRMHREFTDLIHYTASTPTFLGKFGNASRACSHAARLSTCPSFQPLMEYDQYWRE